MGEGEHPLALPTHLNTNIRTVHTSDSTSSSSSSPPPPTSTAASQALTTATAAPSSQDTSDVVPARGTTCAAADDTNPQISALTTLLKNNQRASEQNSRPTVCDTLPLRSSNLPIINRTPHSRSPSAAGLYLDIDLSHQPVTQTAVKSPPTPSIVEPALQRDELSGTGTLEPDSAGSFSDVRRVISSASMASSLSPASAYSSPALNALLDLTPLPSPLMLGESPGPWRRGSLGGRRLSQGSLPSAGLDNAQWLSTASVSRSGSRKKYQGLMPAAVEHNASKQAAQRQETGHSRNRSLSEYTPEHSVHVRPRNVTLSGQHAGQDPSEKPHLHREEYLATQRGLAPQSPKSSNVALPTPPASNRSTTESEEGEAAADDASVDYMTIHVGRARRKKLFRPVRPLGQGTFSKVILATTEKRPASDPMDELNLDPKQLVAIKMVQHGPAGGADEERVELSLKREVEMLQSVSHPTLIHLKAFDHDDTQALLVLTYCAGGDLFDLASGHRDVLSPALVQRIFAELVSAVRYLHKELIVHRDIKLENVLCNSPYDHLLLLPSPTTHPTPLITLTDLGLSRRIPAPPASQLLTTRCGSEDYAAPEILLGQSYDGRTTDAWALGVLLYALMEGTLPFDPPPGKRGGGRSRTAHRVARCDWSWYRFGDEDGEWDSHKAGASDWEGARKIVEGLLKKVSRGRLPLEDVEVMVWVQGGIRVDGGLKFRGEDRDEWDNGGVKDIADEKMDTER